MYSEVFDIVTREITARNCLWCTEVFPGATWQQMREHETVCPRKLEIDRRNRIKSRRMNAQSQANTVIGVLKQLQNWKYLLEDADRLTPEEAAQRISIAEELAVEQAASLDWDDLWKLALTEIKLWAYGYRAMGNRIWPEDDNGLEEAVIMLACNLACSYGFESGYDEEEDFKYPTNEDEAKALRYGIPPAAVLHELYDWMKKPAPKVVTMAMEQVEVLPWRRQDQPQPTG